MKPTFIMMIGISGSGKSYYINKIIKDHSYTIVSPDEIRREVLGNISDQSSGDTIWRIAKERVVSNLKQGKDVILDATNVNTKSRRNFIKDLPDCNLKALILPANVELSKERIKKDLESGKDRSAVPPEVVDRQYKNYLQTLKDILQESFVVEYL